MPCILWQGSAIVLEGTKTIVWQKKNRVLSKDITDCEWYEHFKCVFGEINTLFSNFTFGNDAVNDNIETLADLNRSIDPQEVREAIRKLKTGKAHGTDGILADMLKVAGETAVQFKQNCSMLSLIKVCIQKSGQRQSLYRYSRQEKRISQTTIEAYHSLVWLVNAILQYWTKDLSHGQRKMGSCQRHKLGLDKVTQRPITFLH